MVTSTNIMGLLLPFLHYYFCHTEMMHCISWKIVKFNGIFFFLKLNTILKVQGSTNAKVNIVPFTCSLLNDLIAMKLLMKKNGKKNCMEK